MNVNLMSSSVACNEKHMSKATNPMDIVVAPTTMEEEYLYHPSNIKTHVIFSYKKEL